MTFYRILIAAFLVSVAASATYAKPPKLSTTVEGYKACFDEARKITISPRMVTLYNLSVTET